MAVHTEHDDWATLHDKLKQTFNLTEGSSLTLISVPPADGAIVTSMDILHTMDKEDVIYVIPQPSRKVDLSLLPAMSQPYQTAVGHLQQALVVASPTPEGHAGTSTGKKKRKQGSESSRKTRKVSAYSLFKLDFWKLHQAEQDTSTQTFSEISKACGAKWKELDAESRAKYEAQAQAAGEAGTPVAQSGPLAPEDELTGGGEESRDKGELGTNPTLTEICQVGM